MQLRSAGAAETVTGSAHHIVLGGLRLLIDCGLFQGGAEQEARNREPFPFDVASLDAVFLTHGHLDHVGRLPLLVRAGYAGPIYCNAPTAAIAEIVLRDSARLHVEDFERDLRRARRAGREREVPEPLYDESDVERTVELFQPVLQDGRPLDDGPVSVVARRAGHILGSSFLTFTAPEGVVIFSGDLGNRNSAVQQDFELPAAADAVLVETTYADRDHRSLEATLAEFRAALQASVARGGKIIIPTFALERTQNILFHLNQMLAAGELPPLPIYLDSPMGARMTGLYARYGQELQPEVQAALARGEDPFSPPGLTVTASSQESRAINDTQGPAIILAGSGMMTGGRVLHHLRHHLWKPDTSLIIVSYQGPGSLGGRLLAGAKSVRILGDEVQVNAQIHTIGGFSAHADQDDLLAWLAGTGTARVWFVHGEPRVMHSFLGTLRGAGRIASVVPRDHAVDLLTDSYDGSPRPDRDPTRPQGEAGE